MKLITYSLGDTISCGILTDEGIIDIAYSKPAGIVQVKVEPDVEQFERNDAATRAFHVGSELCQLELSATTIQPAAGFPVSLDVTGTDTIALTNVLDLTVLAVNFSSRYIEPNHFAGFFEETSFNFKR